MRALFVAIAMALCACGALAGPPFITDDPEPVDLHHWEVYIASIDYHLFGIYTGTLPHVEVNYGAVPNVQIHLIAPLAYARVPGQSFQYGYGDTELGVKFRFVPEKAHQPMVGIFPLLELPTGNAAQSLGTGSLAAFLPVWLQKSHGAWTYYGGGGYWRNPGLGNEDYWFEGVTAQCQTTKSLMLGFEIYHTSPQVVATGQITAFNLGGVYDFDEGHHLLLSVGTGFSGQDHGTAYLAYQWTFGPHEKDDKGPGEGTNHPPSSPSNGPMFSGGKSYGW